MKIRVKYCGGCNPRYDRKSVTERLRASFPGAEFVEMSEDGPFDFVTVLCGCTAACAAHEDLHGTHGKMIVMADEQYDELEETIRNISG